MPVSYFLQYSLFYESGLLKHQLSHHPASHQVPVAPKHYYRYYFKQKEAQQKYIIMIQVHEPFVNQKAASLKHAFLSIAEAPGISQQS